MDPAAPDPHLSKYRLERLLGQGGMGAVYLARDLALDRPVAIKFISPDRAADPVARQRLLREARAAAALEHPNICVIHEVIDEPGGRACIVMQYVEGETLASRLRSGALEVRLALSIAAEIASALSLAHKHDIIHRDIKPQNIVLTPDHHAKLLDFGLALNNAPLAGDDETTAAVLTTPGALAGTPAYMSPEQAQGLPLDGRSDLFSLECVLYEP
jgi:serine/threonine protein kinase